MQTSEGSLRGMNYIMLSSLFYKHVTRETIEQSTEIAKASTSYLSADKKAVEAMTSVMDSTITDEQIVEWQAEFASAFLLPTGVRPYESVYRGEKFQLKQEPWLEVKRFYLQCGFELDRESGLLEDHVSAELVFMAYLIEQNDYKRQQQFYQSHISQWVPQLLKDAKQKTNSSFYTTVIDYTAAFIETEAKNSTLKTVM